MSEPVLVLKLNTVRQETWRYEGTVLRRGKTSVLLEAYFNRNDLPFHGIVFGRGDRFVEIYFTDRWYNIYEIHDRGDDHLKGWYCNITRPAEFDDHRVSYVDLALDLLVYPDGRQLVLDEDEFADLSLDAQTRSAAQAALAELRAVLNDPRKFKIEDLV